MNPCTLRLSIAASGLSFRRGCPDFLMFPLPLNCAQFYEIYSYVVLEKSSRGGLDILSVLAQQFPVLGDWDIRGYV